MKYIATVRRPDGSEYESELDTTAGDQKAVELARNLAESYGFKLVGLKNTEGKEVHMGTDDQNKDTEERVDEQDKTTSERVDEQEIETRDVSPNKTGDVKPDR